MMTELCFKLIGAGRILVLFSLTKGVREMDHFLGKEQNIPSLKMEHNIDQFVCFMIK